MPISPESREIVIFSTLRRSAKLLWEVITAKISYEKVEVHFAKVGGAVFFTEVHFEKGGAIFLERCVL